MVTEPEVLTFTVTDEDVGQRLDRILVRHLPDFSRSTLQQWIDAERVQLDGQPATSKSKARSGQRVDVRPLPPPPSEAVPQDIPLNVLHEDEDLLVIDKPAGLVVHPAAGHADGTLVNAVLFHTKVEDEESARPGIVHRLDKDTSGVMVIAKSTRAREGLIAQFKTHDIERAYVAIAVGAPPNNFTLDTLHGRHPVHRKKFSTRVPRGKQAITHVRVLERLHGAALVECRLDTGRTHQIRVHLAEAGYPLLGDPLYGSTPKDDPLRAAAKALGRQALHAGVLGFVHPVTGENVRFTSPPPADFQTAVQSLRSV